MVVILRVFHDFWAYMLLWTYGMVGIIVWMWKYGCCRMNSGETWHSRPGDPASPRRDWQKQTKTRARALAQAESFRLSETPSRSGEKGSPKRGRVGAWGMCYMDSSSEEALFGQGVFSLRWVAARLSENPGIITPLQLRVCQVCSPIHPNPSPRDSLTAGGVLQVGIEPQTWPLTPSQLERCHQLRCSITGDISPVGRVLKVRFGLRFPLATTHLRWGNPRVRGWGVLGCRPDMLSIGGML